MSLHAEALKRSFPAFIDWAWPLVDPAEHQPNWHIDLMARYLEAAAHGEIRRLLINIPPGCQKSLTVSVFWPAWVWTWKPQARFMATSYSGNLALGDADRCRSLIRHPKYQRLFGDVYELRSGQDTKGRYENNKMGYRFSSAISSIMGEGGNFAILDDPHNVERAESDIVRDETVRKINLALPTRIRSITGALVVIMQRIHERDYSASMLSQPDIVHLCLPMRYEPDHPHVSKPVTLPSGRVLGGDPRTKADELLFPHLFPDSRVTALETVMGAYGAAGQMQQRPSPRAGGIFKREWLQRRVKPAELPTARVRVRGWDLAASVEETASWTAGVLLSHYDGHFYVEDVVRLKGLPGDVQNLLQSTARRDGLSTYQDLPQDPGQSGKSQIHSLTKLLAGYMVRSSPESGSKPSRADAFSGHCQHGHVSLVESHWTNAYVDELVRFPRGDNDQGDGSSRAFNRLVALGGRLEVSSTVGLH